MKNLLFICMCSMLNLIILSSDELVPTVDYMKLYKIPQNYNMHELVTLDQVIQEVKLNKALPLTHSQYWGIVANKSDIFYECMSINTGQDIIERLGNVSMKRIVAEYILVTHLQDHNVNLDDYGAA